MSDDRLSVYIKITALVILLLAPILIASASASQTASGAPAKALQPATALVRHGSISSPFIGVAANDVPPKRTPNIGLLTTVSGRTPQPSAVRPAGRLTITFVTQPPSLTRTITPTPLPSPDLTTASVTMSHPITSFAAAQITTSNVNTLQQIYQVRLPEIADGVAAYLTGVATASGARDLLFLNTKAGRLVALDAADGSQIWAAQASTGPRYTTSSPVVDPNHQYVYSYGLDGKVHKYQVGDGREVSEGNWPEVVTIHPDIEKISSPLTVATAKNGVSYLYAAAAGFDDLGPYHGHVTTINLASGTQHIFNTTCSLQTSYVTDLPNSCPYIQSAIWGRAGVVYDSDTDRIYFATGNGAFSVPNGGHSWGDTILALKPDGSAVNGFPLDSYTPINFQELSDNDKDIGSASPTLLPPVPGSKYPHLAVQAGKDEMLRLINLDDMSSNGGPGNLGGGIQVIHVALGGEVLQAPATWVNPSDGSVWLFVVNDGTISGWQVTASAGTPSLTMRWQAGPGGSSPVVDNGILYYASSHNIYALDPLTGQQLWADTDIGNIHWESVLLAGGHLYITDDDGHLSAYAPGGHVVTPPASGALLDPNDTPNSHYFAETGHIVKGRFLTYWQEHGDVPVFGFPVSDPLREVSSVDGNTYTVQYFQRAEFEYHPQNVGTPSEVLLTALGSFQNQQRYALLSPDQTVSSDNPYTFTVTGKTLGGAFRAYWEKYGGLATFGYPISNEFQEISALDGNTYTVQYFERAELEFHPQNLPPYDVQPAQLGAQRYQQSYPPK